MSEWVRLGDYVSVLESGKRESGGAISLGIPSLGAEHLDNDGKLNLKNMRFISSDFFYRMKIGVLHKYDILIVKDGATTGKVSYVSETFPYANAAINEHLFLLRTKKEVDSKYLFYFLHSDFGKMKILDDFRGSTVGGISKNFVKLTIPLLSLVEQQHIVSVLDTVSSLIDARKKQIALLDEAEKSLFVEMFGDPVENPKGWDILSFSDIAVFDTRMTTDFEKYADVPHIGIENIESVTGRLVNYKLVKDSNLISGKYVFTPKHIIYSKIRPNLNKVAIPNFDGLCSADAYPILPKDNCLKDFLVFILRSKFFISFILRQSDRANIPKVNKKQIQEFKMPLPPLSLQKEFAARISAIEDRRREMEAGLQQMEEARSALMQEYFG